MSKKVIYTPNAPEPIGSYSQAILTNENLFVSGQIPLDPSTGQLENGGIRNQTHRVMKNIHAILEAAGVKWSQVVKCSIFVSDLNDFGDVNEVYGTYFDNEPPARETVEVSRLPKDVRVEISCIATID